MTPDSNLPSGQEEVTYERVIGAVVGLARSNDPALIERLRDPESDANATMRSLSEAVREFSENFDPYWVGKEFGDRVMKRRGRHRRKLEALMKRQATDDDDARSAS